MSDTQQTQAVGQVSPWATQSKSGATPTSDSAQLDAPSSTVGSAPDAGSASTGGVTLGPFALRDLVIIAAVVLMFIGTLLPLAVRGAGNFWTVNNLFYLGIGILLPLAVLVLLLLRGFKVLRQVRIGSLTLEQFSSVVASFATAFFFLATVTSVGVGFSIGYLISLIGAVVMLLSTVLSPWIPALADGKVATGSASRSAAALADQKNAQQPVDLVGSTFAEPQPVQPIESTRWQHPAADPVPSNDSVDSAASAGVLASGAAAPETNLNPLAHAGQSPARSAEAADSVDSQTELPAEQPSDEVSRSEESGAAPAAAVPAETAAELPAQQPAAVEQPGLLPTPAPEESLPAEEPQISSAPLPAHHEPEPAPQLAAEPKEPESFAATVDPADRPNQNTAGEVTQEAFWFAVDKPKAVVDEHTGGFLYNIEPGSWFLALQDRGYDYIVQNADGKLGVLRDLRNIERAPRDS
ncbi:hypothetical protein [Psychromicrobium lacuslunae]|uniref:Uncharacterized protein n=1 Tax=Psychromicrobium lacuslunae TaxID=1618207 RepID=A0A0D4C041_9MICC|nr:hypothetical protein [Psychromicrobium lacuslunae]AJT41953.1 hypothetical protein UM93_11305 [Psychromicrobium lacuslunae]